MHQQQTALSEEQVREVASHVLSERFGRYGFKTIDINEDEDMDGATILRMVAEVESRVPARDLVDTLLALQAALESSGEDRTVFLSTHVPGFEEPDEDEEE